MLIDMFGDALVQPSQGKLLPFKFKKFINNYFANNSIQLDYILQVHARRVV